jgi:hypothetical protein
MRELWGRLDDDERGFLVGLWERHDGSMHIAEVAAIRQQLGDARCNAAIHSLRRESLVREGAWASRRTGGLVLTSHGRDLMAWASKSMDLESRA